jgi:hypothetical protein
MTPTALEDDAGVPAFWPGRLVPGFAVFLVIVFRRGRLED